jgi:hypothetical protein
VVDEEARGGAVFIWRKVQAEIGCPEITTEGGGDSLFAVVYELREDLVVLSKEMWVLANSHILNQRQPFTRVFKALVRVCRTYTHHSR